MRDPALKLTMRDHATYPPIFLTILLTIDYNDLLIKGGGSSAFFGDLRQKERMATWMDSVKAKSKKVQKTKGKTKK